MNEKAIKYKGNTFIVKCINSAIIVSCTKLFPWIDTLNRESIVKKYDINKLCSLIYKYFDFYNIIDIYNNVINDDKLNIICMNEKNNLKKIYKKSIIRHNKLLYIDYENKIPKIFNCDEIANIIINEYADLYKYLMLMNNIDYNNEINNLNDLKINNLNDLKIINGNIYEWKINLYINDKIGSVIIIVKFHPDLYPNYPPVINVISPILKNDLNKRIMDSKYTQFKYWNSQRTMVDITRRTKNILDKFGIINEYKDKLNNLDKLLSNLASLIEIDVNDVIDTDQIFVKNKQSIDKCDTSDNNGIGFNNDNISVTPIKNYEIKDNKFEIVMNNIIEILNAILDENGQLTNTIDIIGSSKLIEYITYKFKTISLVEISSNSTHYKLLFNLIQLYCFEPTISIFFDPNTRNSLYKSIKCLYKKAIKTLQFNDQNDYANTIINIYNMIRDAKKKKLLISKI